MLIIGKKGAKINLYVEKGCKDTSKILPETKKSFQKQRLRCLALSQPVAVPAPE